jgi:delta(3,5)-delta(2,4)-dienoyl-CoA isomerase
MQDQVSSIEACSKPVIAAISGICYGFGVDLISACDIRFCSSDVKLSVKEIDIGMAADMGSLQRLPKIIGNHSWLREIIYSAKIFGAEEAFKFGLVSRTYESVDKLLGKKGSLIQCNL